MMLTKADFKTLVVAVIVACLGVVVLLVSFGGYCIPRGYLIASTALLVGGLMFIISTLLAIHTRHREMTRQAEEFTAKLKKKCDVCPDKDDCNMRCDISLEEDE